MKKHYALPILLVTLLSCSSNNLEYKVGVFGTIFVSRTYDKGTDGNLFDAANILRNYDQIADNYYQRELFNVYSINQQEGEMTLSKDLYDMLKVAFTVSEEGARLFNPLCGSLSKKWKEALDNNKVLSQEEIDIELEKMNNTQIIFKENNVIEKIGEAEIDLGGIAKGYALDRCQEYFKEKEISRYMISGGRSSILLGEKNTEDGLFSIGVSETSYIKAKNCFISTSGISEQGVEIEGITYSHIINPETGSAINNFDEVTIISETGYFGDALSTSLVMCSLDEIKELEESLGIKALVKKNGSFIYINSDIEVINH